MTPATSRRSKAWDMTMLLFFTALFPVMSGLHDRLSNDVYHLLAGLLLGGIASLSHALLHDGFVRWRNGGLTGIESTQSLRLLLVTLVYPSLGILSGVIWLIGTGPNVGLHYAIGIAAGGFVMGWRAKTALARKRALGL